MTKRPHEEFTDKAVECFRDAVEDAKEIWPPMIRREAFREWATTLQGFEILDSRTRAAVLATLLPIVAIGEETDPETALRNVELLFVAILEQAAGQQK